MSCYTIYYRDGVKKMRPVVTEAEYRNLRNTMKQHRIIESIHHGDNKQKHRLLQCNYSCIPAKDMRLKGVKTPSMSVGWM